MHQTSGHEISNPVLPPLPPEDTNDLPPPYQECSLSVIYTPTLSSMNDLLLIPPEYPPWPYNFPPHRPPPDYCVLPPAYSSCVPHTNQEEIEMSSSVRTDLTATCPQQETRQSYRSMDHVGPQQEPSQLGVQCWCICINLIMAVIFLIIFPPFGIPAFIYIIKTRDAVSRGDQASAASDSRTAFTLNMVALGIGIAVNIVWIAVVIYVNTALYSSYSYYPYG
ncbi:uncharacterized protein LOC128638298 isoform X1 [Bombina bombina]|uniref:uncharacterized protein LOC128638298 isoform X1 n=1 Tax=Bombina bombina TaxID=8345 RepID=UPI00235A6C2E|nr:uncharacterized protein LOC128638298 isoform X1 [Bombina bombina]